MTRGTRSKSRTPKISENVIKKCDDSSSVNGTVNVDAADSSTDSLVASNLSKKRTAEICNSVDSTTVNRSPPSKKRHLNDLTRGNRSVQKRQNETPVSEIKDHNPVKVQKVSTSIHRSWTKIVHPDMIQSANSNTDTNDIHNNFVVASYNIAAMAASFHNGKLRSNTKEGDNQHDLLMDELSFIDADIFCLQQVSIDHWKALEDSLLERGFRSCILVSEVDGSCGVATFYRMSRFVQVKVDNDKLSKLCLQNIHHNNTLNEDTMNSIKKYLDEPESYIVTLLRDLKHERLLIVGNTRLSDDKDDKPDLKCVQVVGLFWSIYRMMCQMQSDHDNNNSQVEQMLSPCWILCGDLGPADSPVYQICRDGYPSELTIERLQAVKKVAHDCNKSSSLIDLIWNSFQHPFTDSCNSYLKCHDASPHCIWTSERALQTHKVLLPVAGCGQTADGAAQDRHLSLACDVAFVT